MQTPAYPYPPREKFDTQAAANYLGVAPQTLHNWRFLRRGPEYHHAGRLLYYLRADRKFLPQSDLNRSLRSVFRREGEMNADRPGPFLYVCSLARALAARPELHDLLPGLPRPLLIKTALYRPNKFKDWDRSPIGLAVRNVEF